MMNWIHLNFIILGNGACKRLLGDLAYELNRLLMGFNNSHGNCGEKLKCLDVFWDQKY